MSEKQEKIHEHVGKRKEDGGKGYFKKINLLWASSWIYWGDTKGKRLFLIRGDEQ